MPQRPMERWIVIIINGLLNNATNSLNYTALNVKIAKEHESDA
jgi:hypothetical protein